MFDILQCIQDLYYRCTFISRKAQSSFSFSIAFLDRTHTFSPLSWNWNSQEIPLRWSFWCAVLWNHFSKRYEHIIVSTLLWYLIISRYFYYNWKYFCFVEMTIYKEKITHRNRNIISLIRRGGSEEEKEKKYISPSHKI